MKYNDDEFLWVQRYRPRTIKECAMPAATKAIFNDIVKAGRIPNMLLAGGPGTGKTTAAMALCNELGVDVLFLNASLESRIDVLRTTIQQFASSVSLSDSKKVVILDEADYSSNSQAFQPALRGMMEEFSNNCTYILTCNYKSRIIEPIHSRCKVIDFKISAEDKSQMAIEYLKTSVNILKKEGIEYDTNAVAGLVKKHFPDFRRILNELQSYSNSGKIDSGVMVNEFDENYKTLFKHIKDKNFAEMRKWIAANADVEQSTIFRQLFDKGEEILEATSVPQLILILGDYQSRVVADAEINMAACLVEIMGTCKFRS